LSAAIPAFRTSLMAKLARIFHNPVRLHDPCRLWRF
jgi:hypothetical protein